MNTVKPSPVEKVSVSGACRELQRDQTCPAPQAFSQQRTIAARLRDEMITAPSRDSQKAASSPSTAAMVFFTLALLFFSNLAFQ
ncbi:MAG: hypothetical protein U1F19_06330 [Lysobacterales bacterium]